MAKRRANGEGNLRKRSDGRWEGRYIAGYDPDTGKRIIKNVLGETQAEVREKLKLAVTERLVPFNPAANCKLPPKEKKEMQIIPPEKLGDYLRAASDHGVLPMFYLELTSGLRRGELLALLWTDLNVKEK